MFSGTDFMGFVSANRGKLTAYCYCVLGDWTAAERTARHTLMILGESFEGRRRPEVEMWKVARRLAVTALDRLAAGSPAGPAEERRPVLTGELIRLPLRQREVVAMVHGQRLTEAFVAEVLGITVGSVRIHLARAEQGLAELTGTVGLAEDLSQGE